MIEILALIIAFLVLTIEYGNRKKIKTEAVCKVWVQENRSSDWICVETQKRLRNPGKGEY